jgi:peptidoglycan biosynthesis protein MviN/MurJ (putative lipid II flippase)
MIVILAAFSVFHLIVGTASLGMAVRLLTRDEREHWRSKWNLFVAELTCWLYPVIAFVCAVLAWRDFSDGRAHALLLLSAPFGWFIVMGIVFAVVDYAEDGILGNARTRD